MKKNLIQKLSAKMYLFFAAIVVVILVVFIVLKINKVKPVSENNISSEIKTQAASAQTYTVDKSPTPLTGDKKIGLEGAPVKIFVYEDYTDKYSADLAMTLDKIYALNPNKILISLRPFIPANSLLAKQAALAVTCAGEQDKWLEMRALLFTQTKNNELAAEKFADYAKQLKLEEKDFAACLTNSEKNLKIEELAATAAEYNVLGTPTIFIGGEVIIGARPYEDYTDSNGDNIKGLASIIDSLEK